MRRELLLLVLCICGATALAAGVWFFDLRKADAGSTIFTVDNIFDDSDANLGDGICETVFIDCTLRAAIQQANFSGADTIQFNIGTGVQTISPGSAYPALTDSVEIDGTTQSGYTSSPLIVIDGVGAGGSANGLVLNAGSSTVRGLNIQRFGGYGISTNSFGSDLIEGNYIGTDVGGTLDRGNTLGGIRVNVGGTTVGTTTGFIPSNVISGNDGPGIDILTGSSIIQSNYIGLNASGTGAIANSGNGISIATGANTIGGTTDEARNVISGNSGNGILVIGESADSNVIEGNYIGLRANGTTAQGNTFTGVGAINGADGTIIGGTTAGARNVISANGTNGVGIGAGGISIGSVVEGDYIGTDKFGTADVGNTGDGVALYSTTSTTVGGTSASARNVISGNNGTAGVEISGGTVNTVSANYIGTNASGSAAIANSGDGVALNSGASFHTIGGTTAGERNIISGNTLSGVSVQDATSGINFIQANYIGTNAAGTLAIGNNTGVTLFGASNLVGGTTATPGTAPGNLISGNVAGVTISGDPADGNNIYGNLIGTDVNGTADLGNTDIGVFIVMGADNTVVGGLSSNARNVISGNDVRGVGIFDAGTTGNVVSGNYIGTNITGTAAIANTQGVTIANGGASGNTIGGALGGARNVISGNTQDGVRIGEASSATGNFVQGNYIGLQANGITPLGNGTYGVIIQVASTNNLVGGYTNGARNVISGNALTGVVVLGAGSTGNTIAGNYIGTDATGNFDEGNVQYGVVIDSAQNSTVGGTISGARNLISGNGYTGIGVGAATASASGTVIVGNYVGTNAAGTSGIPNTFGGVGTAYGASGVRIGGTGPGEPNLIAFNGAAGVIVGSPLFPPAVSAITVRGNSIHDSTNLGIDLFGDGGGPIPNDNLDVDTGDNGYQNFPVITSAQTGSSIIRGSLNSTASSIFLLDFYANSSCDSSGNGEGQTYLGAASVVTDGSGNATFEVVFDAPLAVGQAVTGTATDTAGSTSEFSGCFTATAPTISNLIGTNGTSGDCGPGPTAVGSCLINLPRGIHEIFPPEGVASGQGAAASGVPSGLYWAEGAPNSKIKKLEPANSTGNASDVAGGGSVYCNNCIPTTTLLNGPRDVFIAGKAAYIADTNDCTVRRVDFTLNRIFTVAGQNTVCSSSPTAANGDGGSATSATLNSPRGVAVDAAGNLYIADTLNNRIRMVAPEPAGDGMVDGDAGEIITTIAGTGTPSAVSTDANGDGGLATAATFNQPHDVYFLVEDLIIADTNNDKIRRIDYPAGTIATIAGGGSGCTINMMTVPSPYDGCLGTQATVNRPEAVSAANGKVVIADTKNHIIRMVDLIGRLGVPATPPPYEPVAAGTITTIVPCGTAIPPSPCQLNQPAGVFLVTAPDAADGALRISNTDGQTIMTAGIDPTGTHTTNIRPSVSCGNVPGVSGIDWVLPIVLLGAIAGRRRIGTFFTRLYAVARRRAPARVTS